MGLKFTIEKPGHTGTPAPDVRGVCPFRSTLISPGAFAGHRETWLRRYVRFTGLGPRQKDKAQPVETWEEEHRVLTARGLLVPGIGLGLAGLAAGWFAGSPLLSLGSEPRGITATLPLAAAGGAMAVLALWDRFIRLPRLRRNAPPALPVYLGMTRSQIRTAVSVEEDLTVHLEQADADGHNRLARKVTGGSGRLRVDLSPSNTAGDLRRLATYRRWYKEPDADDICCGFLALDEPLSATWIEQRPGVHPHIHGASGTEAASGLVPQSDQVLRLSPGLDGVDLLERLKRGDRSEPWRFEAAYDLGKDDRAVPGLSVSAERDTGAATDGGTGGGTIRLSLSRPFRCEVPDQVFRVRRIMSRLPCGDQPSVQGVSGSVHGADGQAMIAIEALEDCPQTGLILEPVEPVALVPGDRLEIILEFSEPAEPFAEAKIPFEIHGECTEPFAGFRRVAAFDPLGWPGRGAVPAGTYKPRAVSHERAQFLAPHTVNARLRFTGQIPLMTDHPSQPDICVAECSLPDSGATSQIDSWVIAEMVETLSTHHGLIFERIVEERGDGSSAMAWSLTATNAPEADAQPMTIRISPNGSAVRIRVSAKPGDGSMDTVRALADAMVADMRAVLEARPSEDAATGSAAGANLPPVQHTPADRPASPIREHPIPDNPVCEKPGSERSVPESRATEEPLLTAAATPVEPASEPFLGLKTRLARLLGHFLPQDRP